MRCAAWHIAECCTQINEAAHVRLANDNRHIAQSIVVVNATCERPMGAAARYACKTESKVQRTIQIRSINPGCAAARAMGRSIKYPTESTDVNDRIRLRDAVV